MSCCVDSKVRVPRKLRTVVPNFEKDGEPPPPKEEAEACTHELLLGDKPLVAECDTRSMSRCLESQVWCNHNQGDSDRD